MARPALAATRALQVIDLFVLHPKERFSLSAVSARTGINTASAHALLTTMTRQGYVQRDERKTYSLGPALVAAGAIALVQLDGLRIARTEIDGLSTDLDLEVVVSMVAGDELLIVDTSSFASAYGAVHSIGQRLPIAPPIGSVFLAWSSEAEVEEWLARAPSISEEDAEMQRAGLRSVRQHGFAVALESDAHRDLVRTFHEGPGREDALSRRLSDLSHEPYLLSSIDPAASYAVAMIASPVFDDAGRPSVALALSGFKPQLLGSEAQRVADRLCATARLVTKRSGGRLPR